MLTRIMGYAAAGFMLGIFYASLFPVSPRLLLIILAGSVVALIVATRSARYSVLVLAVFCICAFVFGTVRFEASRLVPDPELLAQVGERVPLTGIVIAEPDVREGSVRLTVQTDTDRVLVVAPALSDARYGDRVIATGMLHTPEPFESGSGRVFDYPMYLATRGITFQMTYAELQVESHGGNPLIGAIIGVKHLYINGLRAVLPEPYAGLAAGITAGDKRSVGSELSEVFQRVSLVHILVLSGYNITVVLSTCTVLLTRLSRRLRLCVTLAVILFFIVISGGAASAVRAGAMAFAAGYATLFGRQFIAIRVLLLIATVMLAGNPYLLVFDPGFQLSMLATFGLIAFAPGIVRRLSLVPERYGIREVTSATLATQMTVLPLLLYSTGTFSIVALPANMLALIVVPYAMFCSAIAALAGIMLGTWGTIIALPAYVLLRYIVLVADVFASLPFASVSIPPFSAWQLIPLYAAVVVYAYVKRNRPGAEPPAERVTDA